MAISDVHRPTTDANKPARHRVVSVVLGIVAGLVAYFLIAAAATAPSSGGFFINPLMLVLIGLVVAAAADDADDPLGPSVPHAPLASPRVDAFEATKAPGRVRTTWVAAVRCSGASHARDPAAEERPHEPRPGRLGRWRSPIRPVEWQFPLRRHV